jgi:hypothetical protein
MKKKYLRQFFNLFGALSEAGLILSGRYDDNPEQKNMMSDIVNEEYNNINKLLSQPVQSNLMLDLIDEIEKNLYRHPDCREIYLKDIIRFFVDVVPYLDIDADIKWLTGSISGFRIGNSTFSKSHGVTIALIIDH